MVKHPHSEAVKKRVEFAMEETKSIWSGIPSQKYKDNWDAIFGKNKKENTKGDK